jgi:uncharacterized membrane protein YjjP (DUF1212 family)
VATSPDDPDATPSHPGFDHAASVLCALTSSLLRDSAEGTFFIRDAVRRCAAAYGVDAQLSVLPEQAVLTVTSGDEPRTFVVNETPELVRLDLVSAGQRVVQRVEKGQLPLEEAAAELKALRKRPAPFPWWLRVVGVTLFAAGKAGLSVLGVLALAVIGPTTGRWYIDVSCGVPPKQFIRGEWFVTIAALTGLVWLICDAAGLGTWWSAGISFVVGFTVRLLALYLGWEEPLAKEPAGVYQHSDGRPLLGRKIADKSQRELHDLGLVVENPASGADS